jgi:hypothetical protein
VLVVVLVLVHENERDLKSSRTSTSKIKRTNRNSI